MRDWQKRFDEFAARKTTAAVRAPLFPFVTRAAAPDARMAAIGSAWSRSLFDGPFYVSPSGDSRRAACSLVFVQSADGNTGADDPASLGGGNTDKHLIYEGLSRVAADAVFAGAGTVRGADIIFSVWHPQMVALRAALGLPRHPIQIVVTDRGLDVDGMLLFNVPGIPVVLLTGPSVPDGTADAVHARPWITQIPVQPEETSGAPAAEVGLAATLHRLHALGIRRLSCVGGRTLARELLDANAVDDVYLTTAAQPGGEAGTPISTSAWRGRVVVRKEGTGPEAGVRFEHVLPRQGSAREERVGGERDVAEDTA